MKQFQKKEMYLIVMEEGIPVKRPFAEILLDYPITPRDITEPTFILDPTISWNGVSRGHYPSLLVKDYLMVVEEIQRLSQEIIARRKEKFSMSELYEMIMTMDFSYASTEAHEMILPKGKKEKEDDFDPGGVAHYQSLGRIVVSLPNSYSSETVRTSTIHEHGHLMHDLLDPYSYNRNVSQKDFTLIEAMAIIVEEELNANSGYPEKTSHGRAKKLLHELNQTGFGKLCFADRWMILSGVSSYQKALEEIVAVI